MDDHQRRKIPLAVVRNGVPLSDGFFDKIHDDIGQQCGIQKKPDACGDETQPGRTRYGHCRNTRNKERSRTRGWLIKKMNILVLLSSAWLSKMFSCSFENAVFCSKIPWCWLDSKQIHPWQTLHQRASTNPSFIFVIIGDLKSQLMSCLH